MTSLEEDQLLDTSKDSGGARVIEAFLSSDANAKQKRKLIVKYVRCYMPISTLIMMEDPFFFFFFFFVMVFDFEIFFKT